MKYLNKLWKWIDKDDAPDRKFFAFCITTLFIIAVMMTLPSL